MSEFENFPLQLYNEDLLDLFDSDGRVSDLCPYSHYCLQTFVLMFCDNFFRVENQIM